MVGGRGGGGEQGERWRGADGEGGGCVVSLRVS